MCEEGIAAIENLYCFFVYFSACREDLRIYWRIAEESRNGQRWYDEDLAVYLVSNLAGEI